MCLIRISTFCNPCIATSLPLKAWMYIQFLVPQCALTSSCPTLGILFGRSWDGTAISAPAVQAEETTVRFLASPTYWEYSVPYVASSNLSLRKTLDSADLETHHNCFMLIWKSSRGEINGKLQLPYTVFVTRHNGTEINELGQPAVAGITDN